MFEASNRKIGPKVTTVYALRKPAVVVWMVEWSPLASSLITPELDFIENMQPHRHAWM